MNGKIMAMAFAVSAFFMVQLVPEQADAWRERKTGIEFNGFVDFFYHLDHAPRANAFQLSEIELDVIKTWKNAASLRLDLNYMPVTDAKGALVAPNVNDLVEQMYMTMDFLKKKTGLTFTVGKFNVPMAWEKLDATDTYQTSRGLLLEYGLPKNAVGFILGWERGPFKSQFFVVNGWEESTKSFVSDNNDAKTLGLRLEVNIRKFGLKLAMSGIYGSEGNRPGDTRTVFDVNLTFTRIKNLMVGLEFLYGYEAGASKMVVGQRARWLGAGGMAHYRICRYFATTLRFEHMDDADGARLSGVPERRRALSVAALFTIAKGAGATIEFRRDWSDVAAFEGKGGQKESNRSQLFVQFTYTW